MKKTMLGLALGFGLLASSSCFADTYKCVIPGSQLGPNIEMDLNFELVLSESESPRLSILGDVVSNSCQQTQASLITCRDAEGMPHTVSIINDEELTLTIGAGMFLPETSASCVKS